jgi:hypothetical protein
VLVGRAVDSTFRCVQTFAFPVIGIADIQPDIALQFTDLRTGTKEKGLLLAFDYWVFLTPFGWEGGLLDAEAL